MKKPKIYLTNVALSLFLTTLFAAQLLMSSEQIPEKFDWHQVIEIPELESHWWEGHQVINFFPKDKDYHNCPEAVDFVAEYLSGAQPFNTDAALLKYGSDQVGIDGMYLEMGSGTGRTINFIAALNSEKIIYGFDSFEGLPEAWVRGDSSAPQGTFAFKNSQMLPPVLHNVRLIKGWFNDSLPKFNENILKEGPIAFLHIDCDLYSSTKSIFDILGDHIIPGTIIVFDEFYNYPGFENHEFKAFQEFLQRTGKKACYLGFNQYFEQVVIRIE